VVISELRQKYPLERLLITAKLPRSSYYYHLKQFSEPQKHIEEQDEIKKICGTTCAEYKDLSEAIDKSGI